MRQCFKKENRERGREAKEDNTPMNEFVINDHLGNGRVWFIDQDNNGRIDQNEERFNTNFIFNFAKFTVRPYCK